MAKHLPDTQKRRLAISVLEGDSYAEAGERFGVAKTTAKDICNVYFRKIIMPGEAAQHGVEFSEKISNKTRQKLRQIWRKVSII